MVVVVVMMMMTTTTTTGTCLLTHPFADSMEQVLHSTATPPFIVQSQVQANPHFTPTVVAFAINLPGFPTNTSSAFLICPVHATFSAHLILQYSV
jgi:hypothetical protein